MAISLLRTFTATTGAVNANGSTLAATMPAGGAAVGDTIILICQRSDVAGNAVGVAGVTDTRSNTWSNSDAIGVRSGNSEVVICSSTIGTAMLAGDTITVTWNHNPQKRQIAGFVYSGIAASGFDQSSNQTPPAAGSSGGANGNSAAPTASTGATSQADELVIGGFAGGVIGFTPGAGLTAGPELATTSAAADRQLSTVWKVVASSGAQTANGTWAASQTWSGAAATYKAATAAQSLAPTSDITVTGWTFTGGVSAFSTLDEAIADDSDFATSPPNPTASVLEVRLAAGTDPNISTGHAFSYRIRANNAASSTVVAGLYQAGTLIASETRTNVPSTFTTYTMNLNATQANAISDYANLRIRLTCSAA